MRSASPSHACSKRRVGEFLSRWEEAAFAFVYLLAQQRLTGTARTFDIYVKVWFSTSPFFNTFTESVILYMELDPRSRLIYMEVVHHFVYKHASGEILRRLTKKESVYPHSIPL